MVDLTAKQVEANIAHLEGLVLAADLDISDYTSREGSYLLDGAIATVARYSPQNTVYDIIEAEEMNRENRHFINLMREIVRLWQDPEALRSRVNLLDEPVKGANWQDGLRHHLARALASQGRLMRDGDTYYGWTDWEYEDDHPGERPVAVFDVHEDYWEEFEGTFTEGSHHHGITGIVMMADGSVRKMRYEADLSEMLGEVLGGVQRR